MASKKQRTTAPKKIPETTATLPTEVTQADFLTLQIAAKSLENIQLKMKLAQANFSEMQTEKERLEKQFQNLVSQANEKYTLAPGKDKISLDTGVITRG